MRFPKIVAVGLTVAAFSSLALVGPAAGQIPIPTNCFIAQAGLSDAIVIPINLCAGTLPEFTCNVQLYAYIFGYFDPGEDARVSAACGEPGATAHAEVPELIEFDFDDEDSASDGPGPFNADAPCNFDPPGSSFTLWYMSCTYTSVP
ncbi:MAG: hypothetical protein ACT4OM_01245 [Actinomycetota bacterium]